LDTGIGYGSDSDQDRHDTDGDEELDEGEGALDVSHIQNELKGVMQHLASPLLSNSIIY
jgi:hypothetical protein